MPHRYAVLWETAPELDNARPVGLVVEQEGFVLVEVRNELGIASRYDKPFEVLGPDLVPMVYRPGDPGYFDQVILDLSRSFIVGKEGIVAEASEGVILKLLSMHVFTPLRREHPAVYCDTARTFPTVAENIRRVYYTQTEDLSPSEKHTVRDGEACAAVAA